MDCLRWKPRGGWKDYYSQDSYTSRAWKSKISLVERFLEITRPRVVWDLGANTGVFSRLAVVKGARVVAMDFDPACTELNYLGDHLGVLPLTVDLTNPSPGIGWRNKERLPIWDRGRPDTILALALVHHLAIGNNLPLDWIASFLSGLCNNLIVEFVPKEDPKVQQMLSARLDIFPDYTQEKFEASFREFFRIEDRQELVDSCRCLYRMVK